MSGDFSVGFKDFDLIILYIFLILPQRIYSLYYLMFFFICTQFCCTCSFYIHLLYDKLVEGLFLHVYCHFSTVLRTQVYQVCLRRSRSQEVRNQLDQDQKSENTSTGRSIRDILTSINIGTSLRPEKKGKSKIRKIVVLL